ncbi:MAG: hypothetical protein H6525_09565 [Actinobacteria bacterium]|nr:hypothetical protein [Actinomycetota bacterium]MCB9413076.1 hypothetical protein [Actinomycetota bacterium]
MRAVLAVLAAALLALGLASPAAAEGGKMRGSVGTGPVVQNQVMDPPPFSAP